MKEKIIDLKIEKIDINLLIPYQNNAKEHPEKQIEQIKKSILEFGNNDPIAIDKNNIIVEGHGRYLALKGLKYKEVEIIRLDHLTEEQRKAYSLIHNKLTMNSAFDLDLLEIELNDIINIDMNDYGFDLNIKIEVQEDEYEIVLPENPKSKTGDIYQLGSHRLMCGDSTNKEDVLKLMNNKLADMILTDPPYNVAVNDESKKSLKIRNRRQDGLVIQNDKLCDLDFTVFLSNTFNNYYEITKEGAPCYIFYADAETVNFISEFKKAGFHFAQNCIWNKHQFVMTRKDYHYKHEPILYGWKTGLKHNWFTDRKQSSVWDFERPFKNELHPTMKPLELLSYPISNSSKQDDIVADFFGGSGSTLITCEQLNRQCYMMESDQKYVDVIIDRWEKYTGKKAILLTDEYGNN